MDGIVTDIRMHLETKKEKIERKKLEKKEINDRLIKDRAIRDIRTL